MTYHWYDLYWSGIVNPLVFFAAGGLVGLFWGIRWLSNRTYVVLTYALCLGWLLYVDHMLFSVGLEPWLIPLPAPAPLLERASIYAAAVAFGVWGTWGWVKLKTGKEKMRLSRGLPYLRERKELRKREA